MPFPALTIGPSLLSALLSLQPPAAPPAPPTPSPAPPNPIRIEKPADDPAVVAAEAYAAVVGQAWTALNAGDSARAKTLLAATPAAQRQWEYAHMMAWAEYMAAHPDLAPEARQDWALIGGKESRVNIDIDATSRWLAFGGTDAKVHIFDLTSGKEFQALSAMFEDTPPAPPKPPEKDRAALHSVYHAVFSRDGSRLVTGAGDGGIRVFDTKTWKLVGKFREEAQFISSLAVNQDASRIAVVTSGKNTTLWKPDAEAGAAGYKLLATLGPAMNFGRPVAFSQDGKLLAVGGMANADLFDASTGTALTGKAAKLGGGSPYCMALAFSPDGKYMASGCRGSMSKSVHLFTIADDTQVYEFQRHTKGIQALSFSADSRRLLTASIDGTARLLDTPTGAEILKLEAGAAVRSAILSADGKYLALGTAEGVRLYGPPPAPTPAASTPK